MSDYRLVDLIDALDRIRVQMETRRDKRGLKALLCMSDDELVLLAESELRAGAA